MSTKFGTYRLGNGFVVLIKGLVGGEMVIAKIAE